MNPLSTIERFFSGIRSTFSRIGSLFRPVAEGAKKPWLKRILLSMLLLLAVAVLIFLALALLPQVPARFWQLLVLSLVALTVIWWFAAGQKQMALKGRTKKRIGDLGPGNADDEREPLQRMGAAIDEAKRTIARSPDIDKGRDPLYRIPWILVVGDDAANVDGVLRGAADVSPFPAPEREPMAADDLWRWWFFKSMIAIEMHPRVVCDANARLDRGLWYQSLMKLAASREKLPLSGLVVAVSVQSLLGPAEQLKETASRLRRLVDEAMEHLQVRMPVYFMVTGLEKLSGYAQLRASLPEEAFAQALGHRLADDQAVSAATSGQLHAIVQPIEDRLHALRMTAMRAQSNAVNRHGLFELVESLRKASQGLELFVNLLLEDNPFQRTPRWRGLYFVGGQTSAHRGGAFLADLFTRFLPADQPLAAPSLRGSAGRMGVAGLGVLAMLGLSAALAYGLSNARKDDSALLAQTRSACAEMTERVGVRRIDSVASCGRTITRLETAARGTLFGFGIRRADRDIEQLKTRVTEDFANLILAPYDQMLTTDINQRRAGIDHLLALTQRIRLLDQCRKDRDACRERELPNNVSFDANSRLFSPFVSPDHDTARDRDNAAALFATYLGYLRWQKKSVLDAERDRLQGLLDRLLTGYTPNAAHLREWADARNPRGLPLEQFWLPEGRVVGSTPDDQSTISTAYTRDVWEGVVAPMLETYQREQPAHKPRIGEFRTAYFNDYFADWASFMAGFQNGVTLWRGHYDELLTRAAGPDSPYLFFFRSINHNLYGLPLDWPLASRWNAAWSEMKSAWLSSWRPFGGFVADSFRFGGVKVAPPIWLLAIRDTESNVLARQQADFARAYLRLQAEGSGQDVYQVASEIFASKGRPEKPPASEYASLLDSVDKPPEKFATGFKGDDLGAWSVVQGPSRLLLFLTVYRAGDYVQQRWSEGVLRPLAALPPQEQISALYGEQGKLGAFVNDWLKPFITEKERLPVKVAGVAMPLSPAYQSMVASERRFLPVLDNATSFPAGTFGVSRPSDLGALNEGDAGTVLEIDCRERVFRASSVGESLSESKAQVFWSPANCLESRIRVSLALPAHDAGGQTMQAFDPQSSEMHEVPAEQLTLTRIYSGADGFVRMVNDFSGGSHAYGLEDFRASYSPQQWSQIAPRLAAARFRGARVYLQVEPSPELRQYLGARTLPAELPATILE